MNTLVMSLVKINIEKPALVEERVYPDEDSAPATASTKPKSKSKSSDSSSKGLLKPVLSLLLVGVVLVLYKRRSGSDDESFDFEADDLEPDDFEIESSGSGKTRLLGLVMSVFALAVIVLKLRSGTSDE